MLTTKQAQDIRKVLQKGDITGIAEALMCSRQSVYRVLWGQSGKEEIVNALLERLNQRIKELRAERRSLAAKSKAASAAKKVLIEKTENVSQELAH